MKGLPSGYNQDLQEDKEAVFEAEATLGASLDATAPVVAGLTLNARAGRARRRRACCSRPTSPTTSSRAACRSATRTRLSARIVRMLVAEERDFSSLSLDEWQRFSPLFGADIIGAITPAASVAAKRTPQSTNPDAVAAALAELQEWLR